MFIGAVPMPVVNQLLRAVDCSSWREIFVCCSGSFRVDRALKERYPQKAVRGNDVSLVSCAVGTLLTGGELAIAFKDRLAFIEEREFADYAWRVAAVIVALRLSQFSGKNAYAQGHFEHCRQNFDTYLAKAHEKVLQLQVGGPARRVLRRRLSRPRRSGHARGRRHRRLHADVQGRLRADVSLPRGEHGLAAAVVSHLGPEGSAGLAVDRGEERLALLRRHRPRARRASRPATEYRSTINKPVYGYLGDGRSSFRRKRNREASFAYQAVDPATLGPLTDVQLVPASSAQLTFLRNMYLAKGIAHATGIANYLVHARRQARRRVHLRPRSVGPGRIDLPAVGLLHRARTTAGEIDRHARRQQRDDRRLVSAFRGAAEGSAHDRFYRSTCFHEISRNL